MRVGVTSNWQLNTRIANDGATMFAPGSCDPGQTNWLPRRSSSLSNCFSVAQRLPGHTGQLRATFTGLRPCRLARLPCPSLDRNRVYGTNATHKEPQKTGEPFLKIPDISAVEVRQTQVKVRRRRLVVVKMRAKGGRNRPLRVKRRPEVPWHPSKAGNGMSPSTNTWYGPLAMNRTANRRYAMSNILCLGHFLSKPKSNR
ncbi:hypothetical protein B0T19DRAFT_413878 [Cercophora scortea]|uniref:Uncharacterized protein n=1 Tax=Cercophora scortea TaxID=314031 RepID=A0AAE0IW95_9PEZI|nr:hypothetical protein B0T19DRAFT_413878 [Cercophora scortea]